MGLIQLADTALINNTGLPTTNASDSSVDNILTITFSIIGAIAFLVILIAGLSYVFSSGEPEKVAKAKNTIIYAVIGLVVAALSFAFVKYVLSV